MNYRTLGNTGIDVSEVSFGTWAIGGSWGQTNDQEALNGLARAMDAGVNFFDTADVYGLGHAEELLAKATKGKDNIYIATKFCRKGDETHANTYKEDAVRNFVEDSLRKLDRECIDLYQIHCPPLHILKDGNIFSVLEKLKQEGKIRGYGVSVETIEEGHEALRYEGISALQVIFNIFRQLPLETLFPQAHKQGVGILARVPLASGLLTGKFSTDSTFAENDHRQFNKNGERFSVGETFAGLTLQTGVQLADQLKWIAEGRGSMTQAALRWILDHEEVTCAIPGFKRPEQVEDTLKAIDVPSYSEKELQDLAEFYKQHVHHHIRGAYA
ncbi:aldo/keto reductase [Aureibacillus halotolerans]|uniref:Aryl-alcohol dehydrogenase-like predicted oxidoreductase n=1 Tax=Aureibacillus halotolerans TaxID=1508390 RepID=A0A4R6UA81_9BACI|nr:aldo/keto reductase [Aureibacillus halotolerans]TDQ42746.1 aryl-alcohol dehydrogenase-like predicted oxidoreductase [Aureibacillus halotolerans]